MLTRYLDRRRHIRIPASGPAQWSSDIQQGHCEVCDISPTGAGLRMSARKAAALGTHIDVDVEIDRDCLWRLAQRARVVRRVLQSDGQCIVGVEFDPQPWD